MTVSENQVYFIGAGPGDVKYLTLEGRAALQKCGLVYAVDPYPETYAALLEEKAVHDPFKRVFEELVEEIQEALPYSPVAFLVPGDMTVFSPFLPIVEHFERRSKVVAGVGILNASAALLKHTLDLPGVSHSVLLTSARYLEREGDRKELEHMTRAAGTLVLYMNKQPLNELAVYLSGNFEPETPVAILSCVGMADERLYECTLATMAETVGEEDIFGLVSGDPSLAVIIIGNVLEARSDPAFWNKNKERFWDRKKENLRLK
jgi:precorrin-4/cobalt-precorrin-4 C11-methyltransferase